VGRGAERRPRAGVRSSTPCYNAVIREQTRAMREIVLDTETTGLNPWPAIG
jgi:hypothetical protein